MPDCSGIPDLNPEELVKYQKEREFYQHLDQQIRDKKVEVTRFSHAARRPAVRMFQPTHFVTVSGDNLKQWETFARQRLGLPASAEPGPPQGTISGCSGGCPPWDDSDA